MAIRARRLLGPPRPTVPSFALLCAVWIVFPDRNAGKDHVLLTLLDAGGVSGDFLTHRLNFEVLCPRDRRRVFARPKSPFGAGKPANILVSPENRLVL